MRVRAIDLNGPTEPANLVGVMVLLDRSGSMRSIKGKMIDAFGAFIDEQKALDPEGMWVSLYQFDASGSAYSGRALEYETCYERTPLAEVPTLSLTPRGDTPLNDAIMRFAGSAKVVIDDPNDPTERLLLVIITDGCENASTHSRAEALALLNSLKSADCEVLFIGEQSAVEHAVATGYTMPSTSVGWQGQNVSHATVGLSSATANFRAGTATAESALANYVALTSAGAVEGTFADVSGTYADAANVLRSRAATRNATAQQGSGNTVVVTADATKE